MSTTPLVIVPPGTSATFTGSASSAVLDDVRTWFGRFIRAQSDSLDVIALWTVHTHLLDQTWTTPRLLIESLMPGSGKTTTLDHMQRLSCRAVLMSQVTSTAMLVRLHVAGYRTMLVDEVDRTLDPKKDGVGDILAVLNSGYRKGATRPVLVPPTKGSEVSDWRTVEMPTYAPCVMAGNSPLLPDDTVSRSLKVMLFPDVQGVAEDSDWEDLDPMAAIIRGRIERWADQVRETVRVKPELPEGVRGRLREKWGPLKRVANAAGGRWPALVDRLAMAELEQLRDDIADGIATERPHVLLLRHLAQMWAGREFIPTGDIVNELAIDHPEQWGEHSGYGKRLTPQRMGQILAKNAGIRSSYRRGDTRKELGKGYRRESLTTAWSALGIAEVADAANVAEVAATLPLGIAEDADPVKVAEVPGEGVTQ